MTNNIRCYTRRHKNDVSELKSDGESRVASVPSTPQKTALLTRRAIRISDDHRHCVAVSEEAESGGSNSCEVASAGGGAKEVVNSASSECNVEKKNVIIMEVNEGVLSGGDDRKQVDFNALVTSLRFDNEEKVKKHEDFESIAEQPSVCDDEKECVFGTTQEFVEEERNGSQTLGDEENEEKNQKLGCNNPRESGFDAESRPVVVEHNLKKKRGNSLDKNRPRKRAKVKKVRPKVAFEDRTTKAPQQQPKSVEPKTPAKNPSEPRQKRKYLQKVKSAKKEENGNESEGVDAQNNCSRGVSSFAASYTKSRNITDSNGCHFDLPGLERGLSVGSYVNGKEINHALLEYNEKESAENAGGDGDNANSMDKNPNQCSAIAISSAASCTLINSPDRCYNLRSRQRDMKIDLVFSDEIVEIRKKKRTQRRRRLHYFLGLHHCRRVTTKKRRSYQPTRKVELASFAVVLDGDKIFNVGVEPSELKPEFADCPQISNCDKMVDDGLDQLMEEIATILGCKESLIDPMNQTLKVETRNFLSNFNEPVHEEMSQDFKVGFLGSTTATEDAAEKNCGSNEENIQVVNFPGRAVASEFEGNGEMYSAGSSLQLGLGPRPAFTICESSMLGQQCLQLFSQSTPKPSAFESPPLPKNFEIVSKSTGLNEIRHTPKTPRKINEKNALVRYKGSRKNLSEISYDGAIVPVTHERKFLPKVELDEESLRMWELTERIDNGLGSEEEYNKDEKLQEQINVFKGRIESFTSKMHLVLGDRRFKEWKGSVVDSVVGVFLTQNVSDTLSSSAFMSLAAKYPVQSSSNQGELDENLKSMHSYGDQYFVTMPEPEPELNCQSENKLEDLIDTLVENFPKLSAISSDGEKGNNSEESTASSNTCNVDKKHLSTDEHVLYIGTTQPENGRGTTTPTGKKKGDKKKNEEKLDWESYRRKYERPRTHHQRDSVDWEAVRTAEHCEVASTIKSRGQHTILAGKIQEFLNRTRESHNAIDLEWLRYVHPDIAKKYLLEINGVGLKSTECIRLLALQHVAFPVDTNVGRMAVRLGWVPLKTLPGNLELHLLSDYPPMDDIQKYIWPRIRGLGQRNLYELHYHMITFGKVFCTKRSPNCNACPMRAECRHFASAFASANFRLPAPSNESKGRSEVNCLVVGSHDMNTHGTTPAESASVSLVESKTISTSDSRSNFGEPIVEEPQSPPLVEQDIEDLFRDEIADCDDEEIPTIKLSNGHFSANVRSFLDEFDNSDDNNMSRAIVPISVEAASIPARKQKQVTRLRTEHLVYEIPDSHELLEGLDKRDSDDPVPYLLAIWSPGETAFSSGLATKKCNSEGSEQLCDDSTCNFCETFREAKADIVRGTFLIPCRTALKAKFPLNGTYFQVNEVFADHETSYKPINIPRNMIWNLRRRTVLVGTSTSSIFNGVLSLEKIQENFWRGYVCVRGIERKTGAPKPLSKRFHCSPSKIERTKRKVSDEK